MYRANSQATSSYPLSFSTDVPFSSLVSFAFCILVLLFVVVVVLFFVLNQKDMFWYTFDYAGGRVIRLEEHLNNLRNLNEIFRKDVTYDNIKSHKKPGFHPLFRRHILGVLGRSKPQNFFVCQRCLRICLVFPFYAIHN